MSTTEIISNIIIGLISGIISGLLVNACSKKIESKKLNIIKADMLDYIFNDTKIYIHFFINKPINDSNYNVLIKYLDKMRSENLKISYKSSDVKPLLLQLNKHVCRILDNEIEFKINNWMTATQINNLIDVYNNINFYLNSDKIDYSCLGVTSTLLIFFKSLDTN